MTNKAYILCGGKGTRLKPFTNYIQKCMLPIGTRQAPILEYIVKKLIKNGFKSIYMVSGYMHEQIENYFNSGRRFGAKIRYVVDKPEYNGSLPGLIDAYYFSKFGKKDIGIVWMGDILANVDVKYVLELLNTYNKKIDPNVYFFVDSNFRFRVGIFNNTPEQIYKNYMEKPKSGLPVHIGIGMFNSKTFSLLRNKKINKNDYGYNSHFIPFLCNEQDHFVKIGLFEQKNLWWSDVGLINLYNKLFNKDIDLLMNIK